MIDYNNDESTMVMSCDGYRCDQSLEMIGDFLECIQEAKDNGWHIICEAGLYEHYCPRCWANRTAKGVFE